MKYCISEFVVILLIVFASMPSYAERVSMSEKEIHAMPVQVYIDLFEQEIYVIADNVLVGGLAIDNVLLGPWKTSTGRVGLATPAGTFRSYWLDEDHRSSKYNNAPMWNSVFIYGGIALHETAAVSRLGKRVSHGCIRLSRKHANRLFEIVERNGIRSAIVVIRDKIDEEILKHMWLRGAMGVPFSSS